MYLVSVVGYYSMCIFPPSSLCSTRTNNFSPNFQGRVKIHSGQDGTRWLWQLIVAIGGSLPPHNIGMLIRVMYWGVMLRI